MGLRDTLNDLNGFASVMEFYPPATDFEIREFQKSNGIKLPQSYIEILKKFDGGELFVPGTIIYGINKEFNKRTVKDVNGKDTRRNFSIPATLLIIGKLNYGDWLCIDLNHNHEVFQWDHEQDEELCRWSSVENWLRETIDEYARYGSGAQS